ncbi:MAG TPA: tRNA isopentenyl-2-thiomethyl-A-37 hydroxylase MiaE [Kofleriaceae bacterium]|jgi:tRNA-(ms[2]io[6]A)-hydroxylase|nr:tRNA isopentenyl-2-thiomethyl-A-37 hydroxylase MiaE [Kofleriaceae bacterium]
MTAPSLACRLPLTASAPAWVEAALADLDAVIRDHLHCERKAAQSALSLVRSYPERADLVLAVARLAHEETAHVVQVTQLLARRGVEPSLDFGDDYAAALREHVRRGEPGRLLDRLLVFALIEARSAERLAILAEHLPDPATAQLYRSLASAEVRHRDTFLELAASAAPAEWRDRLTVLAEAEAAIVAKLPARARIH